MISINVKHLFYIISIVIALLASWTGKNSAGLNDLVTLEEISQEKIIGSLRLTQDWFLNNINQETKTLEYIYFPSKDEYSKKNSDLRQLSTLWMMTELRQFLKADSLDELINNTFSYYLKYIKTKDGYAFLEIGNNSNLAFNAFIAMALLNSNRQDKETLIEKFANGVLALQKNDGSYYTDFMAKGDAGIDYYPGEAMLALMKLYGSTKNPSYIDSVKKAFPYYRDYWRNKKNTAFIPWHTQAYFLLYNETKDPEVAKFIFEMNDWLIDNYQIYYSKSAEEFGAFVLNNPQSCLTSVYLEGINDAYSLAVAIGDDYHKKKYATSTRFGTRFILQTQFNKDNSSSLKNPIRAIGGFRQNLKNNAQRIDYLQHAINSLIKAYKNRIFEK